MERQAHVRLRFAQLLTGHKTFVLDGATGTALQGMNLTERHFGGEEYDGCNENLVLTAPDVVAKEGAEALACAGVSSSGLGVAVKIADGGWRATGPALIHALHQMDALTERDVARLADHARPAVRGGGRAVGEMAAIFDLDRH